MEKEPFNKSPQENAQTIFEETITDKIDTLAKALETLGDEIKRGENTTREIGIRLGEIISDKNKKDEVTELSRLRQGWIRIVDMLLKDQEEKTRKIKSIMDQITPEDNLLN